MKKGVEINGPAVAGSDFVLTPEALSLLEDLQRLFGPERRRLLRLREERQRQFDNGCRPDFLRQTATIRERDWKIARTPSVLQDRRVEITGPAGNRKMVINALNSGANVFMADAEDSEAPTWQNIVNGQLNMLAASGRSITFKDPATGKDYFLGARPAILFFRPRGWHLEEQNVLVGGRPVSASLFDFAVYFANNYGALDNFQDGVFFYLPKMESHLEARLWNRIFDFAEGVYGLQSGTIRATVLIETLPAAFEMHEILWELRRHSAGLNCGRWDYIFSYIKKLREHPEYVLPERGQLTMDKGFLAAYVDLLIDTCHRRGAHAMGGMAAQIPIKGDDVANAEAMMRVKADKAREVKAGHDGTWVAHPALVPVAKEIFDLGMPEPNQIGLVREPSKVTAADLLKPISGTVTEAGLRKNILVAIEYLDRWLSGTGAAAISHLMEDAATAEISRSQVWQWIRHKTKLEDGREITPDLVLAMIQEMAARWSLPAEESTESATELFLALATEEFFEDFLTNYAYRSLLDAHAV